MNAKRLAIIVGAILVVSFIIYSWLGGFTDPELGLAEQPAYQLIGTEYRGVFNHPRVRTLFDEARTKVTEQGTGAIGIFYPEGDQPTQDTLSRFIGYWPGKVNRLRPENLAKVVQADKAVVVTLSMHPLVMPDKAEVREMAARFASEQGLRLSEQNLELYFPDNRMEIIFFPEGSSL